MGCAIYRNTEQGLVRIRNLRRRTTQSVLPRSPFSVLDYPYQIFISYSSIYVATRPLYAYKSGSYTHVYIPADTYFDNAHLDGMQWVYDGRDYREIASRIVWGVFTLSEANYTVYKENPPVNVFFEKTTTEEEVAWDRVRAIKHRNQAVDWLRVNI